MLLPRRAVPGSRGHAYGEEGDVVGASGAEVGEDRVAEGAERFTRECGCLFAEVVQPVLDVLSGAFDQAVGVEEECGRGLQDLLAVGAALSGVDAQQEAV